MASAAADAIPTPAAPAALQPIIDDGRLRLELGMSTAQVRALFPTLGPMRRAVAAASSPSVVTRYKLPQQRVAGVAKLSDIELRFWNDTLWSIIVYFPIVEPDEVGTALRAQYGRPESETRMATTWRQAGVTLVLAPTQRWFAFTDDEMRQAVEQATAAEAERAVTQRRTAIAGATGVHVTPAPTASTSLNLDGGTK